MCRKCFQKIANFIPGLGAEIALKTANSPHICCESRTTDFFIYFVNKFPVLKYVGKPRQRTTVNTNNAVTNNVISNPGKFHNYNTKVINTFWYFDTEQFFTVSYTHLTLPTNREV